MWPAWLLQACHKRNRKCILRHLRDCVTLSNSHFAQLAACLADMHAHYVVAYNYAKGTFGSSETYDIRTITQETCPLLMLSTFLQLNRVACLQFSI